MSLHFRSDEFSFDPFRKEFASYSWALFRQDAFAGISVALLTVPQAMAYALLAGLPLTCGLFAAIYSTIIAAIFGSSRHLIAGPSNALAILVQTGTAEILYTYYRGVDSIERELLAVQILTQLALLTGVLQLIAAWAKLGRLTQFVSHSVIIGYISGTALAMVINQLFVFSGIERSPEIQSLYENALYLITHLEQIQWPTATIGIGSLLLIFFLRRINKKIPAGVIAFAAAAVLVEMLGLSSYSGSSWLISHYFEDLELANVMVIGDKGDLYDLVPSLAVPFLNVRIMNGVLPVAFVIALLSVMESVSVAKSIAANSGQRLCVNQEIFGLSLGNIVSSLIGAMPVSGSPSRSNVNYNSGGQTRLTAIFSSFFVAFTVFILGFFVTRIPLTSLAALLLITAASIVNMKQVILCLRATNADAFVFWATFLSCIFFSLDMAFYIGVALSITLYLKKAAIPHLVEYEVDDSGELRNIDYLNQVEHKAIRVIKVEGELFFGAADLFQTTLKTLTEDDTSTKAIILQLKNARDIDATVCLALQQLHEYLIHSDRYLIACGITPPIWEVLADSGLTELIGKNNLFQFDERHPHQHMQLALIRARALINGQAEEKATQEALQPQEVFVPI